MLKLKLELQLKKTLQNKRWRKITVSFRKFFLVKCSVVMYSICTVFVIYSDGLILSKFG